MNLLSDERWQEVLDKIAAVVPLIECIPDDEYEGIMRRIHEDEELEKEYYRARKAAAAHHMDMELLYAHGKLGDGDVQRDALICKAHRYAAGVGNRDRFSEKKQVEVTHSVDLTKALEQAQARIEQREEKLIEGEIVE